MVTHKKEYPPEELISGHKKKTKRNSY